MTRPIHPFRAPKVVWAAPGAVAKLGPEAKRLGATRVLLVTDRGLMSTGTPVRLAKQLEAEGIVCSIYSDVMAEPSAESLDPVVALAKELQVNLVVGVGGGSAIDVAKAAALLAANGGTAYDYFGTELVKRPGLPMIAVPTTAGTGAEATPNAIFTDTKEHYEDVFKKISEDADFKKGMADVFQPVMYLNSADFTKLSKETYENYGKLIKELNIKLD